MTQAFSIRPGMRAVVIGAGKSGRSAARVLAARGASVLLCDERSVQGGVPAGVELRAPVAALPLSDAQLVVVSPGVPLAHPQLKAFREAHPEVAVWGEIELAVQLRRLPKLAAITGTNGKSTTTALCGEMVRAAGLRTFVGGNLGTPLCEAVEGDAQAHIVELSSFQLEGLETFRPHSAAVLNLTPDHLDRYPSLEAYADAKARVFSQQEPSDTAVLNADDPWFPRFRGAVRARLSTFGRSGDARPIGDGFDLVGTHFTVANRALRGDHNLANAMAAALVALGLGISPAAIAEGLRSFPGLPHRLELIRERGGVEWINDSKATNVESTAVALKAIPGPLLWIAGGRGKGAPYSPLRASLGERLRRALLIGEDGPRIAAELPDRAEHVETLEAAVARADSLAQPGDTVLLSPACASYDQFDNYEQRGQRFRALVEAL